MEYRVYDDRTNETLFTGEHHEAIQFISSNFDEEHENFEHVWLEKDS